MYFVNLPHNYAFFQKIRQNQIEDHKILILMNNLSPKLDEINASYACKYNSIMRDLYVFYQFTT